jgi:hypothetical protein
VNNKGYTDPWAGEKMTRSDAARRYQNLIQYQLRPMLNDRRMSDDARIQILKRIVREASRFKYESGMVANAGTREEVVDLLVDYLKPEHWAGEDLRDWVKRTIRAFGATIDTSEA